MFEESAKRPRAQTARSVAVLDGLLGFANALYIERQLGTMRYGWKPKRVRELIPSESVHVNLSRLPACWTVMSVPFTPDPESIERVVAHSF
jgi:hypothetical protein